MGDYTYVNGQLLPSEDAMVSLKDRSFRFGDGVFETIAIYNGKPYQLALHQKRIEHGLSQLSINAKVHLSTLCSQMIDKNNVQEGFIRVIVSHGDGSKGYLPIATEPNIYAETAPAIAKPDSAAALHLSNWRKIPNRFLPTGSKINALGLNSSLALIEARDAEANQALQLDEHGCVSEASAGNIFWIKDGILYTPSLACDCLDGTTRAALIHLSHLTVREVTAPLMHLYDAECVFIANCAWGIWPVTVLSPQQWTWGDEHTDLTTLKEAYENDIRLHCA